MTSFNVKLTKAQMDYILPLFDALKIHYIVDRSTLPKEGREFLEQVERNVEAYKRGELKTTTLEEWGDEIATRREARDAMQRKLGS